MDEKVAAAEDIKKIVTNQSKKKKQSTKSTKQQQPKQLSPSTPGTQSQQQQQQTEGTPNQQPQDPSQINVGIPLSFIEHIYSVLLIANRRAQWEPQELVPVGRSIEQLRGILIKYGLIQIPQQRNENNSGASTS